MDDGLGTVDVDVGEGGRARRLLLAVAAGAVQLADVLGVEVDYLDLAAAVVLEDLVRAAARAASADRRLAARLSEGGRVFADLVPPATRSC